jgi:hypothetical protein
MVFELLLISHARRVMTGALVEHASDVLRQRYRGEEVVGEDLLTRLRVEVGKTARSRSQQNTVEADQVDRGARRRLSFSGTPIASSPASTFRNTVNHGKSAKVWKTIAIPSAGPLIARPR